MNNYRNKLEVLK